MMHILQVAMPTKVFLLRGNHETRYCTKNYGFKQEVLTKYGGEGDAIYDKFLNCFGRLPLASIIAGRVYTAHGGLFRSMATISSKKRKKTRKIIQEGSLVLGSIEELNKANRKYPSPPRRGANLIPNDVLWSDPSMSPGLSLNEGRGVGLLWGPDCTEDFLKKFNLTVIINFPFKYSYHLCISSYSTESTPSSHLNPITRIEVQTYVYIQKVINAY